MILNLDVVLIMLQLFLKWRNLLNISNSSQIMKTMIVLYIFLPILVITNTPVYGTEISNSFSSFFNMDGYMVIE